MKMPKVDCDAIERAMQLHMVDVEGLLEGCGRLAASPARRPITRRAY